MLDSELASKIFLIFLAVMLVVFFIYSLFCNMASAIFSNFILLGVIENQNQHYGSAKHLRLLVGEISAPTLLSEDLHAVARQELSWTKA